MNNTFNRFAINHLADDWDFYVDLESIKTIPNNEDKIRQKYKVKRFTTYDDAYNKRCNDICDEYNYHIQNNKNDDDYSIDVDLSVDCVRNTLKENDDSTNVTTFIVRASSTTIITAFLTYVVFFIL
jgi:hypothetical protein